MAVKPYLIDFISDKTKLADHFAEQFNVPAPTAAKCESFSQINFPCMQPIVDYIADKILGRLRRKFPIERDNDRLVNAQHF
jgi:hypothetical protein